MLTLADLAAIREKNKNKVLLREGMANHTRIVVSMGTCGIAAGARSVLLALLAEVEKNGLSNDVIVTQTGCVGLCANEPVVEVYVPNQGKVTYGNMDADKAARIIAEHIKGGNVVTDYTIGGAN